jgi:hypothetical protein
MRQLTVTALSRMDIAGPGSVSEVEVLTSFPLGSQIAGCPGCLYPGPAAAAELASRLREL